MGGVALFIPASPLELEASDTPLVPDTPIATRVVVAAVAEWDTIFLLSQMVALGQSFPVTQRPS
jgi:hypothetical protein